jgi:2,3-bisphosphoglycerate-dependent phosphoglycerate mutase
VTPNTGAVPATLYFVRHGETSANERGVRSGGDMDIPLSDTGRRQAEALAEQLAGQALNIGVIVSSALIRAQETAAVLARTLNVPVLEEKLLNERLLGAWNGLRIEDTEADLRAGVTPPGGESNGVFTARVRQGFERVLPLLPQVPLIVASKGVGRVAMTLLTGRTWQVLGNCKLVTLRFADSTQLAAEVIE